MDVLVSVHHGELLSVKGRNGNPYIRKPTKLCCHPNPATLWNTLQTCVHHQLNNISSRLILHQMSRVIRDNCRESRVMVQRRGEVSEGDDVKCGSNIHSHAAVVPVTRLRLPIASSTPTTTRRTQCRFHVQTMTLAVSA